MRHLILCTIRDGKILDLSDGETDLETAEISMSIDKHDLGTVIYITDNDLEIAKQEIVNEYNRRMEVDRIARSIGF